MQIVVVLCFVTRSVILAMSMMCRRWNTDVRTCVGCDKPTDSDAVRVRLVCRVGERLDRLPSAGQRLPGRHLRPGLPGSHRALRQRVQYIQHLPRRARQCRKQPAVRQPGKHQRVRRLPLHVCLLYAIIYTAIYI